MPQRRFKQLRTRAEMNAWEDGYEAGKEYMRGLDQGRTGSAEYPTLQRKKKRKLNSWQKFVKANSNKRKFRFKDGKLKLKSMGIAYRKTAAYKRSKK